jgi:organic hydroperoxide reductase OsmC/OhrA
MCADAGVIVTDYTDNATGTLTMDTPEGARFTEVVLHPVVIVKDASMIEKANALHDMAHASCFIAKSVNFEVRHEPKAIVK